jgi:hypothetical protein
MKPRFEIVLGVDPVPGRPTYVDGDYAFHYVPDSEELAKEMEGAKGVMSLALDTLEIVVSCEKRLMLWIHGYWPYYSWRRHALSPPKASRGSVRVELTDEFKQGITYRMGVDTWVTHFDAHTGWVVISDRGAIGTGDVVEFAVDTLATIDDGRLDAIWVRPANWTDLLTKIL